MVVTWWIVALLYSGGAPDYAYIISACVLLGTNYKCTDTFARDEACVHRGCSA